MTYAIADIKDIKKKLVDCQLKIRHSKYYV